MQCKEECLYWKDHRKQEEKIKREHTAILMMKTAEICQKGFSERISRKLLDKFYEKVYSFHYERTKKKRNLSLEKGKGKPANL